MIELHVQQIILKLEGEQFLDARSLMDTLTREGYQNNYMRIAEREMLMGNFGKAQQALDQYLYEVHKEEFTKQLLDHDSEYELFSRFERKTEKEDVKPTDAESNTTSILLDKERLAKIFDRTDDYSSNDSFCPACQQDPCMCSDPW